MRAFFNRDALTYACDRLGVTKKKVTYFKKTGSGFSNRSFCVIAGNKAYQVRLARKDPRIDRKKEHAASVAAGFSFIHFDEGTGNYVRPWINGKTVQRWDEPLLRQLAGKLKTLHATKPPPSFSFFDPLTYAAIAPLHEPYAQKYGELVARHANLPPVFCHNDVHGSNVILGNDKELTLIDYEWSRMNSALWELGNFIREERLSAQQIGILVNAYDPTISMPDLYDHVFLAACYGWQWACSMPVSKKILRQRNKTAQDMKKAYQQLNLIH